MARPSNYALESHQPDTCPTAAPTVVCMQRNQSAATGTTPELEPPQAVREPQQARPLLPSWGPTTTYVCL